MVNKVLLLMAPVLAEENALQGLMDLLIFEYLSDKPELTFSLLCDGVIFHEYSVKGEEFEEEIVEVLVYDYQRLYPIILAAKYSF